MKKDYPSDIKSEQFEVIRPLAGERAQKDSPRRVELYSVFCAVHSYFAIWSDPRILAVHVSISVTIDPNPLAFALPERKFPIPLGIKPLLRSSCRLTTQVMIRSSTV